ncbi:MAG: ORF6N domain-containing protein [Bacteroidales bacterium]
MMELQLIQNKIHQIRGQKVMLDSDLAEMYGVETRALNQAVKRNIERFPEDFMFQLNEHEWSSMLSQYVMTSMLKRPKSSLPLVFTEHGVTMLSGVLRSETAIQINIQIVRAFVAIRQSFISPPVKGVAELQTEMKELKAYIEEVFTDYNDINEDTRTQIDLINQSLAELHTDKRLTTKPRKRIGFVP